MDKMMIPKKEVKQILDSLDYGQALQSSSNVFNQLPCLTFRIENNTINVDLKSVILYQDIKVVVDIWARSSVKASEMLQDVELAMRKRGYLLEFSADVPNTDASIYHISTRFHK